MVLLAFELKDPCHGKFERHPFHKSLDNVHYDLDQSYLIDQNALLLCPEDHRSILTASELRTFLLTAENAHILRQSRREYFKEIFIDLLELLHGEVLETERASLDYAADVVILYVKGKYFYELQYLLVERVVMHFKMT